MRTDNLKRANDLIMVLNWIAQAAADLFTDGFQVYYDEIAVWFYGDNAKTELADALRVIREAFPKGKTTKDYEGSTFSATVEIPDTWLKFRLYTARTNVCQKVETGETVTKEVIDYSQAPKKTVTEPVIEWKCDPILAD